MSRKGQSPIVTIVSEQQVLRVPRQRIMRLVDFVAGAQGVRFGCVDILIVDDRAMAGHNRRYLDHRGTTDVISFDLSDAAESGLAAQLIVSAETARRVGPIHGHSPQTELLLYILHGLLHVIGHDDQDVRSRAKMTALQDGLLAQFHRP